MSAEAAVVSGATAIALAVGPLRGERVRKLLAVALAFAAGSLALALRVDAASRFVPVAPFEATLEATVVASARGPGWMRVDLDGARQAPEARAARRSRAQSGEQAPEARAARRSRAQSGEQAPEAGAARRSRAQSDGLGRIVPTRLRIVGDRAPPGIHGLEEAQPGQRVRIHGALGPWRERRNPGTRSRRRQLERAGIGTVARLVHPGLHVRRPDREGTRVLAPAHAARARIGERLERSGAGGSLLRALAVGDRSALPAASREAFTALGLSHLLAVSGLHLTLVAGWAFALARGGLAHSAWVTARCDTRTLALGVAWVAAALYAVAAGWGVPVRRALVLFTGLAVAVVRGRAGARAEPLAAAAMVVLAAEPGALFDPGAQLSFAASAALSGATADEPEPTRLRAARALRQAVHASATALAVTSPIAAYHFGQVAPGALLANAIAVPWTALVLLPVALLAAVTALIPGADFLLVAAERVAALTLAVVEGVAAWLPGPRPVAPPTLATLVAAAALGGLALCARRTRWRAVWVFAAGALLALAPPPSVHPAPPRLVVLDVGQGDAFLVQGQRAAILVDAGTALEGFDAGRRVVLPALTALGLNELDLVIATHGDLDHRGGLPSVLRAVRVDAVWIPRGSRSDPGFAELLATAREQRVPVHERGAESAAEALGDLRVTPLWPPPVATPSGRNDRSLVVRIDVGGSRLLLAGDVESAAERALVRSGADLRADVVALPHHGSRTSSSREWLGAVQAEVAVASAPCRGRFGMPHPEVLARAHAADLPVWWTGRDGAVMVGLAEPLVVWGFGDTPARCRDR